MNITLDGYMAGTNCELDWHFETWTNDMSKRVTKELSKADMILLGRTTYQAMAKYWPGKTMDLLCPREDIAFAVMMNKYQKIVYSKTLEKTEWSNSRVINGNIEDEIKQLKQSRNGQNKDIIVYGSGKLVAALIDLNLVDEYQLWIHPVILGKGKSLFKNFSDKLNMKLLETKTFKSGVVVLYLEPHK